MEKLIILSKEGNAVDKWFVVLDFDSRGWDPASHLQWVVWYCPGARHVNFLW